MKVFCTLKIDGDFEDGTFSISRKTKRRRFKYELINNSFKVLKKEWHTVDIKNFILD